MNFKRSSKGTKMKKTTKISTKIKSIGALLLVLMLSVISVTIYLNQKNVKNALIINIAGKERMLTQKISKSIFYLYHSNELDFSELDQASAEFIHNLDSLKSGNALRGIEAVPTDVIAQQIAKVELLWGSFYENAKQFKTLLISRSENEPLLQSKVKAIYSTNNVLLQEVDTLVSMYTLYMEEKTNTIKQFQYGAAGALLLLMIFALYELKTIQSHADEFLEYSKKLASMSDEDVVLEKMKIEAEGEIVEVNNTLNCFIDKVNSALHYSTQAIEQSKNASAKLEEITDEFDSIISQIHDSASVSKQLYRSEDMVIESTEDLINSAKKLQNLKDELDKLIQSCKTQA